MLDFKLNFKINSDKPVSKMVKSLGLNDFIQVSEFVKNLPYKRNQHKEDVFCIIKDHGGTCSTKHAFLKYLAQEHEVLDINLMLGIFMMNSQNTPKISKILDKYHLKEIPEAHNYLKINGIVFDFTRKNSKPQDFILSLVEEIEIQPNQITEFKVKFHQEYLNEYLKKNPEIPYNLEQFWKIREFAIHALQQ